MLENYFCSKDISKKVVELGFKEQCLAYYKKKKLKPIDHDFDSFRGLSELLTPAPLIDQIIEWLLKEHAMFITFEDHTFVDGDMVPGYKYYIDVYGCTEIGRSKIISKYSDCRDEAILKALELIEK